MEDLKGGIYIFKNTFDKKFSVSNKIKKKTYSKITKKTVRNNCLH